MICRLRGCRPGPQCVSSRPQPNGTSAGATAGRELRRDHRVSGGCMAPGRAGPGRVGGGGLRAPG